MTMAIMAAVLENKVWKIHPVCEGVLLLSNASALKFLLPKPPLSLLTVLKVLLVFLLDDIGRFLLVITKLYRRNTNIVLRRSPTFSPEDPPGLVSAWAPLCRR